METRICTSCKREKPLEQFPRRSNLSHLRQTYCLDCRSQMGASWYERNKDYQKANAKKHSEVYRNNMREYIWQYLLTHPCEMCGESDPVVLEFHHNYGKDMAISQMIVRTTKIERLQEELKKCSVLCANCHRRVTAKELGWFRGKK